MKRSKVLPLILITAAAVTGIGVAGFFAIRKYNDLRAGKTLGKIISECPFDQPSGIAWQYIPSDNIAGFAAVGRYSSKYYDLDILVFENGKATDGIDYIIQNYDFADDRMPHYMFSIDEKKISNEEHYTYFFLKNEPDEYYSVDKVSFYKDGVNVTVDYIDDMSITYRKEDEPNRLLTYKHQVFDSGKNRWVMTDDSVTVIEKEDAAIQYYSWKNLLWKKTPRSRSTSSQASASVWNTMISGEKSGTTLRAHMNPGPQVSASLYPLISSCSEAVLPMRRSSSTMRNSSFL